MAVDAETQTGIERLSTPFKLSHGYPMSLLLPSSRCCGTQDTYTSAYGRSHYTRARTHGAPTARILELGHTAGLTRLVARACRTPPPTSPLTEEAAVFLLRYRPPGRQIGKCTFLLAAKAWLESCGHRVVLLLHVRLRIRWRHRSGESGPEQYKPRLRVAVGPQLRAYIVQIRAGFPSLCTAELRGSKANE
ncbi:unnamed protein product [Rangifer tarandus platyrhynchus]|uniref:Uncharacterized protein n=1 Tax=Rangifer tarandus platyrhynchus TaxID=3082113 RepID=A0ABN8XNQ6_RANTA|nr:unnamed protein product [Rangifer tarandus platyrhynchus]